MVNIKVESFIQISTFLRMWYKIRGDAFPIQNLHYATLIFSDFPAGNCILQVPHFLASRVNLMHKIKHRFQSLLIADCWLHFRWQIQCKLDLLESAFLVLTFIHAIAMAGDRWCGKLCNMSTPSCSHKKSPWCSGVIKDVIFSICFRLLTGVRFVILLFVSLPFH